MSKVIKSIFHKIRWNQFWKNYQLPVTFLSSEETSCPLVDVPYSDRLWLPPYRGFSQHNDVNPLLSLLQIHHPETILELGTAYGATVANICATIPATIYTVNALSDQQEGWNTTLTLDESEIGVIYRELGFADRVYQIYENTRTLDLGKYLGSTKLDLVIIDACHDVEFVVNDFLLVLPWLTDNALVLLHDVSPSMEQHLFSSYIACMYLRKMGHDIRYLSGTWWALFKASDASLKKSITQQVINNLDDLYLDLRGFDPLVDSKMMGWIYQNIIKS